MSLFSFEIIEVILRRFSCKESKRYSLAITFYEVKVKEKKN